jgi:uncharacterized membrane protein
VTATPDNASRSTSDRSATQPEKLARALGWVSVGLGIPELLKPDTVTRAVGVGDGAKQRTLATAVGARELMHAAALLGSRVPTRWVWTRVAGDAMDLTALTRALRNHDRRGMSRTIAATAAVAGITAVDVYAAVRGGRGKGMGSMQLTATTTVTKSPDEVYGFWRRLDNLPTFMAHVEEVDVLGPTRSHWKVTAPFGQSVEWDAEVVDDQPGRRVAWRSVEGADVDNEGAVTFTPAPGDRGTEVHVTISYAIPGGKLGEIVARLLGEDPHQQLDDDLRRFKQVMETGEVVRSDGAPWGKRARKEFPQRPAQPLSEKELRKLNTQPAFAKGASA